MILVRRELKGKSYTEPFSKGILSRSLIRAELDPSKAYEIAEDGTIEYSKDYVHEILLSYWKRKVLFMLKTI